jgi:hypothetical protein
MVYFTISEYVYIRQPVLENFLTEDLIRTMLLVSYSKSVKIFDQWIMPLLTEYHTILDTIGRFALAHCADLVR